MFKKFNFTQKNFSNNFLNNFLNVFLNNCVQLVVIFFCRYCEGL